MRVSVDISPLRFPHTGIAVYTLQLVRALQLQLPPDISLIGFTGLGFRPLSGEFVQRLATSNDERAGAARGRGWPGPLLSPPAFLRGGSGRRQLLRFVKERMFEAGGGCFDLFHATVTLPPGRAAKPIIPLVYDLSLLRHPETHPAERVRAFERWLPVIQDAPIVNTISCFSHDEIVTTLGIPPRRVVITRPGVDPLFRAPVDTAAEAEAASRFGARRGRYVLAVGSLEPRKNLAVAMEGFAALPLRARGDATLLIVGPRGWGETRVPDAARPLCESGAIRFTGYVDRRMLRTLYAGAALFVYPSIYEGFGIPAAEALACGARVAASRGSSLDEVVGAHGTLLAPHDVAGWRDAMQAALADFEATDAPPRIARRQWAARFDWNTTAAETLAMYRRAGEADIRTLLGARPSAAWNTLTPQKELN